MKKKLLGLGGLLLVAGMFLYVGTAHALPVRSGNNTTVGKNEVVESTLYMAGSTIRIEGTVNGDVFCAGQDVEVTGTVNGDLICGGQNVTVSGKVTGSARLAGQNVTISGTIASSATLAGQTVKVSEHGTVGDDLSVFGQSLQVDGQVGRDVLGATEKTDIAGVIGRNVDMETRDVILTGDATVGGNLIYTSDHDAQIDAGVKIAGDTQRKDIPAEDQDEGSPLNDAFYAFVSFALIGLVILLFAPRVFTRTNQSLLQRPLASFGAGILGIVAGPVLVVFLLVSYFGVPLALVLAFLWVGLLIASTVFAAFALGSLAVDKLQWPPKWQSFASLVIGLLVWAILTHIPAIGGLCMLLVGVWGFGGALLSLHPAVSRFKAKSRKA